MKATTTLILAAAVVLSLSASTALAQPQWKFHLAFEDGTGARDTIWLIWDTTATFGIDTQFNEQAQTINYSIFNVFIGNINGDTTKTQALPHPHASNNVEVHAINYQYPLTISWDSSLFHAPGLPLPVGYVNKAWIGNNYFFLVNNCPPCQHFDMLIDNTAFAPAFWWGSQSQFPMSFVIMRDESIGINEINSGKKTTIVYPNPANDYVNIKSEVPIQKIILWNSMMKHVIETGSISQINTSYLPIGIYILEVTNNSNLKHYEKVIVSR
jgi:hypothetical protein